MAAAWRMTGIRETTEKAARITLVQDEEGLNSAQESGTGEGLDLEWLFPLSSGCLSQTCSIHQSNLSTGGQLPPEAFPDLPGLAEVLLLCAPVIPVLFIV